MERYELLLFDKNGRGIASYASLCRDAEAAKKLIFAIKQDTPYARFEIWGAVTKIAEGARFVIWEETDRASTSSEEIMTQTNLYSDELASALEARIDGLLTELAKVSQALRVIRPKSERLPLNVGR